MSKVPISVCIIARNEEKYIEECLRRIKPYGFEIIVTDTGSTDRTKEIAAKYADKVLDFEWIDDFSAARNFCTEHASNNWILSLDCDEYVNSIDISKLRILMQKFPRLTGFIDLTNIVNGRHGRTYAPENVVRFYNKNFYTFENAVHEQIVTKDESKRGELTKHFHIPMEVIHHGYDLSPEELQKKQQRNLELLRKSLEKEPDNAYTLFQIGQSEYIVGNFDIAAEYLEKALELAPSIEYEYVMILITSLAQTYRDSDRYKEALELLERYADKCKAARFVFMYALVLLDNEEYLKSLLQFLKAVSLPDVSTLGDNLADCYKNIIYIYNRMGEKEMADMFVEKYEDLQAKKEKIINS